MDFVHNCQLAIVFTSRSCETAGEMAEWSIASDLKSDELTGSVSSNLTLSFIKKEKKNCFARNPFRPVSFFLPKTIIFCSQNGLRAQSFNYGSFNNCTFRVKPLTVTLF